MNIRITSFGQLTDIIGNQGITVQANSIDEVKEKLHELFPELKQKKFALAINNQLLMGKPTLADGDVISLLPPFSGG